MIYEFFEVDSQHFQRAIFFKAMHYSVIGYGIFCNTAGSFEQLTDCGDRSVHLELTGTEDGSFDFH